MEYEVVYFKDRYCSTALLSRHQQLTFVKPLLTEGRKISGNGTPVKPVAHSNTQTKRDCVAGYKCEKQPVVPLLGLFFHFSVPLCNPGPRRNRVWPASPFLPPISSHSFVFRLPVDEHTLKLQLLFELLDIGQLHVRAVWRGLWRRGRSVSACG